MVASLRASSPRSCVEGRRAAATLDPCGRVDAALSKTGDDAVCSAGLTGDAQVVVVLVDCHCAPLRTGQAPFAHPAPHQRVHGPIAFRFATTRCGFASPARSTWATHASQVKLRRWLRRFSCW